MKNDSAAETALDPHNGAGLWISEITLCDDVKIRIPPRGVTAIVGGNNVGKSTLLRQIMLWLANQPGYRPSSDDYNILTHLKVEKSGSAESFLSWVEKNARYVAPYPGNPNVTPGFVRVGMQPMAREVVPMYWNTLYDGHLGMGAPLFYNFADAAGRLGYTFSAPKRNRPDDTPSHALHYLEDNNELLGRLDELYYDIFREHITLDRLGASLQLRIGRPSDSIPAPGYHDDEIPYRRALDSLHPLDKQGDGMKSLIALLLPIMTAQQQVVIVDEPEAFLHPPQAKKLGRILGDLSRENGVQVILATHDRNIIIGLLESKADTSIVRMTRDLNTTSSHQLDPEKISTIWSNPILRYSNVLDGLFHRVVVLAEHDRDCKFYAAALDAAHDKSPLAFPPSEVLFVPTGGKDAMSFIVEALTAVKVPTIATPDIDMLDDEVKMRKLTESLGHDWSKFEKDYKISTSSFRLPREQIPVSLVQESVNNFFEKLVSENPKQLWSKDLAKNLNGLARTSGGAWDEAKRHGVGAFSGTAESALLRLLSDLDAIGLVIVRIGVLESFAKGYGIETRKGASWLRAALDARVHHGQEANGHARRIISSEAQISRHMNQGSS